MQRGKRRFARHQHQRAFFFDADIGGALEQGVGGAAGDGGNGTHAGGADHHRIGHAVARSNRGEPLVFAEYLQLLRRNVKVLAQQFLRFRLR